MGTNDDLRDAVAERMAQVAIGYGEDELGLAITNVLALLDEAERAGRDVVHAAAVRNAIGTGLDLEGIAGNGEPA